MFSHYITIDGIDYPYDNGNDEQHYAALRLMTEKGIDRARYRPHPFTELDAQMERSFPQSLMLFENTRYVPGTIVEILPADVTLMPGGRQCKYAGQLGTFLGWHNGNNLSDNNFALQVRGGRPLSAGIECLDGKQWIFRRHRFQIASEQRLHEFRRDYEWDRRAKRLHEVLTRDDSKDPVKLHPTARANLTAWCRATRGR